MRSVAFIAIALMLDAGGALAASPEDDYIAARDVGFARLKSLAAAKADEKVITDEENKLNVELEKRLDPILGPFAVPGFPAKGKIAPLTPFATEIEFGRLDGVFHQADGEKGRVLVTTRGLVENWLKTRPSYETPDDNLPKDFAEAVRRDSFYTFSIGEDAAFTETAEIAVSKPQGADLVVAELGGFAQAPGPNPDLLIVVTEQKGPLVYIAAQRPKGAIPKIAACEAAWNAALKKNDEDKGDNDYRDCMGARLPRLPVWPGLVKEVQSLANHLAGK